MSLELTGGLFVHGDDGLTMTRAVLIDMGKGFFKGCNSFDSHLIVHKLRAETLVGSMLQIRIFAIEDSIGLLIGIDDDILFGEGLY